MSTHALLTELSRLGITLRADGEHLRITAPKGALTPELRERLSAAKPALLTHLRDEAALVTLTRVPREGALPTSSAQRGLWLVDRLEGGSASYNLCAAVRLEGPLRVDVLERALGHILQRHEALRTCFPAVDGAPVQRVLPAWPVALPVEAVRDVEREAEHFARQPFALEVGPLFRARLVRSPDGAHHLWLAMHHIISDAWSMGLLLRELSALYEAFAAGRPSPLPELAVQYVDFAGWQRRYLTSALGAAQLDYWREQLEGLPPRLELPTDRPRPSVQTNRGATLRFELDSVLTRGLKQVAQEAGATLYMALLAAWSVVLGRYSRQDDVAVGSPVANRKHRETEALIGFFVNTLVLRAKLEGDPSFLELLGRVRQVTLEALAHQDVPFDAVVEALQPERDLSHTPLFQAMFVMHNAPSGPMKLGDVTATPAALETGTAKFDLTLTLEERDTRLVGALEYNTDLFDAATGERMVESLRALLLGAVEAPSRPVGRLPLLGAAQRERAALGWSTPRLPYDAERCIHHLFEAQARQTPDAVAVVHGARTVTYRELEVGANRLAHHLRALGVGPEVLVGFCVERSPEQLLGLLAILKAGGAYLALDPMSPRERNAFMLQDARARVLLTQRPLLALLPESPATTVCLDALSEAELGARPGTPPPVAAGPESLAYVLYTSGSTGRPKGIAMRHGPLANLIAWQLRVCTVGPGHRTLQFAPWNFDICVQESFSTWATGGAVVVVPDEVRKDAVALLDFLQAHDVQRLHVPFVVLQGLAEAAQALGRVPSSLREVYAAGEALQVTPAVEHFFRALPGCVLYNNYGPSEAHVITSHALAGDPGGWPRLPPVGQALPNTRIYLLDRLGQPVPVGVGGEVYVGGDCLARGYLHRPDLTAERFVPDPFSTTPGARLYRTGDLARALRDGTLEYLGRVDFQVKVRGFRVELGEVEAMLCQHPHVREALAMVREDRPGDRRLVAYVAPRPGATLEVPALRAFLKERLPDYMVPSALVLMDALPQTNAGKVERSRLPVPTGEAEALYVAPRTPEEAAVAAVWAEVLGVAQVGVHDHFFERGGHSLLATRATFRVGEALGVTLPLRSLFEEPTVEGLARRVTALKWAAQAAVVMESGEDREQGEL
ncbi:non-ribosomal peptide synthetase [Corallococcus macrosporus]|uniref:Non-ribosomal peptide synthase n=1 Tax=Corallococcus macrosporus DSM 14697 TaxID=1189310 RepID=A0A286SGL8_9BACT|nr:non-ribosomal peptide synthetase [Corallococcus macrosporus]ATB51486.1 non-ribosomal peptide synthase [Corallococcus macrosporus DSM 14697]